MASIRCPKCGDKTKIRTAKKDDCRYYVCINYPECRGRVLADEDRGEGWGGDLGQERPASRITQDSPRRRVKPHTPERRAAATMRKPRKDERKVPKRFSFLRRKGGVSVDDGWDDDRSVVWGDDWDDEIPKAKTARVKPRPPVAPKTAGDKPRPQRAPKVAHDKPRQRRVPKAAHDEAQERKEPETAHDRPRRRKVLEEDADLKKKKPSMPRRQKAVEDDIAPEEQESPEPHTVSEEDADSEKRKRSLIVIIIALVVAFLAIDGIIYAAFVLR